MNIQNTDRPIYLYALDISSVLRLFNVNGRRGKWLPDFIERLKASAWHQHYLPLLPFTHARSESIKR